MKGYVVMPSEWIKDPSAAKAWVGESFEWAKTLPPKEKKKARRTAED